MRIQTYVGWAKPRLSGCCVSAIFRPQAMVGLHEGACRSWMRLWQTHMPLRRSHRVLGVAPRELEVGMGLRHNDGPRDEGGTIVRVGGSTAVRDAMCHDSARSAPGSASPTPACPRQGKGGAKKQERQTKYPIRKRPDLLSKFQLKLEDKKRLERGTSYSTTYLPIKGFGIRTELLNNIKNAMFV